MREATFNIFAVIVGIILPLVLLVVALLML